MSATDQSALNDVPLEAKKAGLEPRFLLRLSLEPIQQDGPDLAANATFVSLSQLLRL
jgi:hypothetical protein